MNAKIKKIGMFCIVLLFSIGFAIATHDDDFDGIPDEDDSCLGTSPFVKNVDVSGCPIDLGQPTIGTDLPILVECGESDNGIDYYSAGTTRTTFEEKNDYCVENTLVEYYCDENDNINDTSFNCPYGYACQDGACLSTCSDGTPYGQCNENNKPIYCDNGELVDNVPYCGCPEGWNAEGESCVKIPLCGDNYLDVDEQCDDDNTFDGDCCSSSCQFEPVGSQTCGIGACQVSTEKCINGVLLTCTPGAQSTEICDNLDNDCDGSTDENIADIVTGTDEGACQVEIQSCIGGVFRIVQPSIDPGTEICDGIDNNCNGQVDEGGVCVATSCSDCGIPPFGSFCDRSECENIVQGCFFINNPWPLPNDCNSCTGATQTPPSST